MIYMRPHHLNRCLMIDDPKNRSERKRERSLSTQPPDLQALAGRTVDGRRLLIWTTLIEVISPRLTASTTMTTITSIMSIGILYAFAVLVLSSSSSSLCRFVTMANAFGTVHPCQSRARFSPSDVESIGRGVTFAFPLQQSWRQSKLAKQQQRQKNTGLFVFERMSEECIEAVVAAQEFTGELQIPETCCSTMLFGCVSQVSRSKNPKPSIAAMQRTLTQYGVTLRNVRTTLKQHYKEMSEEQENAGWLSGFRAAKDDDNDRPFGKDLKRCFVSAGKLADQMGSTTVGTHHVFLALLDYSEDGDVKYTAGATVIDNGSDQDLSAWQVLVKLQVLDDDITAQELGETFLKNLKSANSEGGDRSDAELVTGLDSNGKTPTLKECGTDLTQLAADGLLDPVTGRDDEIRSALRTLIRRRKNNVCLVGDAGVGKTAIAEGVAKILAQHYGENADEENTNSDISKELSALTSVECPTRLRGHRLISLDLAALVAGTKYRGEFEERLQALIKELMDPEAPPSILFLDEIHNLVGAGAAEGGMDAANLLKPALARGELQVIGATTVAEYRKYIEKDAALERRFQPLSVVEPSTEQTIKILQAVQSTYEKHHGVQYTPEALVAAASLSERYVTDRFLPDKALDALDEAGAMAHLENDVGGDLGDRPEIMVTEHTVAMVISEYSGVPVSQLEAAEMELLQQLEEQMTLRVKGQNRAVKSTARAVRRARSGLRDQNRPIASFFFCGPTGTGKTELCKTLAETYFGKEKDLIRMDMSEYMEKHSVSRLTGPPPGYVGYEEGGQLTEAVRRAPHSVVLLDEIEKAHPDVLNILLQIMEDGILTDGKGRTVNFKNVILIMTSNVGSQRILEASRIHQKQSTLVNGSKSSGRKSDGDDNDDSLYPVLAGVVKEELERSMKPEFLNRIDEIVVFEPLTGNTLTSIAMLSVEKMLNRAEKELNMNVDVSKQILERVTNVGSAQADTFGARPLRRAVQRYVEDCLSDAMVQGFLVPGDTAFMDLAIPSGVDGKEIVVISRGRDKQTLRLEVDESSGGIDTVAPSAASRDESSFEEEEVLQTRTKKKKTRSDDEDTLAI